MKNFEFENIVYVFAGNCEEYSKQARNKFCIFKLRGKKFKSLNLHSYYEI